MVGRLSNVFRSKSGSEKAWKGRHVVSETDVPHLSRFKKRERNTAKEMSVCTADLRAITNLNAQVIRVVCFFMYTVGDKSLNLCTK